MFMTISLQINGRWTHENTMILILLSSGHYFLARYGYWFPVSSVFKMAPTLTCRRYAPINVKPQDGGGGMGGGF